MSTAAIVVYVCAGSVMLYAAICVVKYLKYSAEQRLRKDTVSIAQKNNFHVKLITSGIILILLSPFVVFTSLNNFSHAYNEKLDERAFTQFTADVDEVQIGKFGVGNLTVGWTTLQDTTILDDLQFYRSGWNEQIISSNEQFPPCCYRLALGNSQDDNYLEHAEIVFAPVEEKIFRMTYDERTFFVHSTQLWDQLIELYAQE